MATKTSIIITATDKTKQAIQSARSGLNSLGTAAVAAGGASAVALGAIVVNSASAATEINQLVTVAGVGSERFQEIAFAANQYGIEQEKVADILKDTNDKIGDFLQTGGGAMADFFENVAPKVGVTADQFKNLSSDQALGLYVESLEKANVSQQEMTFYMEAIASDSTMLIPLLKDGGKALKEQAEEARKLGIALSDIELAQLREADKQFKSTSKVITSFTNHLSVSVTPIVSGLTNEFLNVAKEAGGMGEIANQVTGVLVKGAGHAANAVQGIQLAWVAVKHGAAIAISGVIDLVAMADRGLTKFINKFTPWSAEINHDLTLLSGELRLMVKDTGKALQDEVNRPLSSTEIEAWYAKVVSRAEEAAALMAKTANDPFGGSESGESSEVSRVQEFVNKNRVLAQEYQDIWQGTFNNFTQGAGDALADVILEQKNGADALRGVMRTVVKGVISGLGEIAAKKAVLWALEKTNLTASTAQQSVAAGTQAAAWAPAAAAASIGSFGSNIPIALAGIASVFALSKNLSGVAHDGLSSVPTDGTYLLQRGEKVVSNQDSKKLNRLLDGGSSQTINVTLTVNAIDTRTSAQFLQANSSAVVNIVQKAFNEQARRGIY